MGYPRENLLRRICNYWREHPDEKGYVVRERFGCGSGIVALAKLRMNQSYSDKGGQANCEAEPRPEKSAKRTVRTRAETREVIRQIAEQEFMGVPPENWPLSMDMERKYHVGSASVRKARKMALRQHCPPPERAATPPHQSIEELLAELKAADITLEREGENGLVVTSHTSPITPELAEKVKANHFLLTRHIPKSHQKPTPPTPEDPPLHPVYVELMTLISDIIAELMQTALNQELMLSKLCQAWDIPRPEFPQHPQITKINSLLRLLPSDPLKDV